jgi:hypothetical protein
MFIYIFMLGVFV